MIIGFAGKKGSGKSSACQYLEQKGFKTIYFADPLKELASELSGVPLSYFYDNAAKEAPKTIHILGYKLLSYLENKGINIQPVADYSKSVYTMNSIRQFLQWLGTDVVRKLDPDFWVKALQNRLKNYANVCIGDVRFANEAKMLKDNKGYVIKIHRPLNNALDNHVSENVDISADFEIYNTSSLEDLYRQIDTIDIIIRNEHNKYL